MLFSLFTLIGLAVALPGGESTGWGGSGQDHGQAPCTTSCQTSVCSKSSVTQVPSTWYVTKTTCVASTQTKEVPYYSTETLTKSVTKTVVVSYPSTVWVTSSSLSVCPEVYYSTCTETSKTAIPTSVCSNTVCPEVTQVPSTVAYASTETICKTKTASWGGNQWGYDNNWGSWDWSSGGGNQGW
jgi:hypothetical protein